MAACMITMTLYLGNKFGLRSPRGRVTLQSFLVTGVVQCMVLVKISDVGTGFG